MLRTIFRSPTRTFRNSADCISFTTTGIANMSANKSAILTAAGKPLEIVSTPLPHPGPDDIVIQNHAIALNPLDVLQASKGVYVKTFPHALGSDVAGVVSAVGSNVTARFQPGDRVVGHCWSLMTGKQQDGAFNLFSSIPASNAAIVPPSISFTDAAVLPMAVDTASCGLFQEAPAMSLDLPQIGAASKDGIVVVYGASSSVGSMVVQLAAAAGYQVVGIASKKNADLVKKCGAKQVFDYNDAGVVEEVVKAIGKGHFIGLYDSIGTGDSHRIVVPILEKLGSGVLCSTKAIPEKLPEGVQSKRMFGIGTFSFPVWQTFVSEGLKTGALKCLPAPLVVGKGLEDIQEGLDKLGGGVSGQKLVIELS